MDPTPLFLKLALALGLGLLVGLQREHVDKPLAGIRTFALLTLLGTLCGLLALNLGGWVLAGALVALGLVLFVGNLIELVHGHADAGLTTEVAGLLMFGVGAYLAFGPPSIAIAVAGTVALILYLKEPLHHLVHRLGQADLKAIMQFVLITLVILPVLPNRNLGPGPIQIGQKTLGPYLVLNPFKLWLLVVLIVGISLVGYVAYKLLGPRRGALVSGLLGGLISSTAATVSLARLCRSNDQLVPSTALAITLASAAALLRILLLIVVAAPAFWTALIAPPLFLCLAAMLICLLLWLRHRTGPLPTVELTNPTHLPTALLFGLLFALVLLAVAVARDLLGHPGLYALALLAGLTDMDAITLSASAMAAHPTTPLAPALAWRLILTAALANLLFKALTATALGGRRLALHLAPAFAPLIAAGLGLLIFWPT